MKIALVNKFKNIYIILIVISVFISIILSLDILNCYPGEDLISHYKMAAGLKQSILSGIFRPYINEVYYYPFGSIDPIIYPFFPKYLLALLMIIFNNPKIIINLFIIIIQILTAIIMYKSSYLITKDQFSSTISTIFWQLFIYRLYNIYTRGAVGEYFALVFYPMVVSGFYNVFFDDKKKWYYLVIGLTLIAESHIITIFYTVLLLIFFCVIFSYKIVKEHQIFYILIKVILFTILINLFFYIPFFQYFFESDIEATRMVNSPFENITLNIYNFIFPFNVKFQVEHNRLGIDGCIAYLIIIIILFISIVSYRKKTNINKDDKIEFFTFFTFSLIAIYHLIAYSYFFNYNLINNNKILLEIFNKQQWSFRELGRGGIYLSIALGMSLKKININKLILSLFILLCGTILLFPYILNVNHEKK